MQPSVILLEFNELCPHLMQRFMGEGRLPNFAKLRAGAQVYTTDAEEQAPYLEPWIQWLTVHSGMSYREHQVFHLGDGHKLRQKCLWDVLSDNGHPVWVCGSMNIRYERPINGLVLPDPWATEIGPSDPQLADYFRFVQRHVQEYTNDDVPLSAADYARFGLFMATHGLSLTTVSAIAKQLIAERMGRDRWKRAVLLDKLQFDVFAHYYRKLKPAFSSFFLNSTAHFQHLYWRNMEPELFQARPTPEEQATYEPAIRFGYEQMDALLGRFVELAGRDTTLMFCTALSQQACLKYEAEGGKVFYRPRDFERFAAFAGVRDFAEIIPVMSECFIIRFKSEASAAAAQQKLSALRIAGAAAMFVEQRGDSLYTSCVINTPLARDTVLALEGAPATAPFFDYFYQVEGVKSGMHHPEGMLWIRRPGLAPRVHAEKLPLTAVAPMILGMFSVARPEHMSARDLPEPARLYA